MCSDGDFQRDCLLRNRIAFLFAEDNSEHLFERVFVSTVKPEFFGDNFKDKINDSIKVYPAPFSMAEHQRSFIAVPKSSAALSEGKRVVVHIGDEGDDTIG
jgi:hypothetical protein